MYNIGDKIVYPMHGAGIIESIEEQEILGRRQKYYILKLPFGDMKVMIPITYTGDMGIRGIIDACDVTRVFDVLGDSHSSESTNWNKRYRDNMCKIKTGSIYEVADVVRSLMLRDKEKGLSTGERKMLSNARQILISELVLVKEMEQYEIEDIIDSYVG